MRRKIITLLVAFFAVATMFGCSSTKINIESHDWQMTLVQTALNGKVVAYSSNNFDGGQEMFPSAQGMELSCSANGGKLILKSGNTIQTEGTYKKIEKDKDAVIYDIKIGEITGKAVVAYTDSKNGEKYHTLVLSTSDFVVYFEEK